MAIRLKYNLRCLPVRRVSTAMTGGGIALVVAVFVIVMAMVGRLDSANKEGGSPGNPILVRNGATTETGCGSSKPHLCGFISGFDRPRDEFSRPQPWYAGRFAQRTPRTGDFCCWRTSGDWLFGANRAITPSTRLKKIKNCITDSYWFSVRYRLGTSVGKR